MYDKVFEQAETFFKPVTGILEINAKAFDSIRESQTAFFNELFSDSVELAKGLTKPDIGVEVFVETQQNYWEGVREKLSNNVQRQYELISDAQGKVGELINASRADQGEPPASHGAQAATAQEKKTAGKKSTSSTAAKKSSAKKAVKESASEAEAHS